MKKFLGHVLAFLLGILPAFFIVFNSIFSDSSGSVLERLFTFGLVILVYGILGFIFGFISSAETWKWGISLSLPAVFIVLLYSSKELQNLLFNIFYGVLCIGGGCLFSGLGARLKTKLR
ncbi:MAG: hypothetical protein N2645_21500 [Clostridia bacterium]|nr:hypothetical protein [Clostridia bacterium]